MGDCKGIMTVPQSILSYVASYLSFEDVLKFRHSCSTFYAATNCRLILQHFLVRPKMYSKKFSSFIKSMNGGRFLHVALFNINAEKLAMLLPHIPNVNCLEIKMQCLPLLRDKCSSLKRLILQDKENNFFSSKDSKFIQEFFVILSTFEYLNELNVIGCKQVYKTNVLITILSSARTVKYLNLESLVIGHAKDHPNELQTFLPTCTHIQHWSFLSVHITSRKRLYLPSNILAFKTVDTLLLPLNTSHVALEVLVIEGVIPYPAKIWKSNNFLNLKHLELRHTFFYHGKLPRCKNLRIIKLFHCHLPVSFLMNLSTVVKKNLDEVWIETRKDFNNDSILQLLQELTNLSKLYLISMDTVTPTFLSAVNHNTLQTITLKNCKTFKNLKAENEVKALEKKLSFKVVLDHCISCSNFY